MTWSLSYARDPGRVQRLTELNAKTAVRFDGIGWGGAPVRQVLAGAWFTGSPGRKQEAAEAWAFEMKMYFHRGVGEQPRVGYANGIYTVIGLIQTTHPGDVPGPDGIVWFT